MKYKLIALDLDGTLNNSKKRITEKTKQALLKAQELGITVALASGRPAPGLEKESKELKLKENNGLLLSFNGAKAICASNNKCIYEKTLEISNVIDVIKHLRQFNVAIMITQDNNLIVENKNGAYVQYEATTNNLNIVEIDNLETYIDFKPCKILISAEPAYLKSVADQIKEPFQDKLATFFSAPFFIEVCPKGVDKGNSLKNIIQTLNIKPEEVIAFGDEQNDLTMIEFAGMGVAMGNAINQLKDVANMVTLSNDEDGIAYAL